MGPKRFYSTNLLQDRKDSPPRMMNSAKKPTYEEWLACSELAFDWAESYDEKDWTRLQNILAPTLVIDYGGVNNALFTELPANDFITMMKNPLFLGDRNIVSQHLLGLSKWDKVSDTEIVSQHQSRAAHIRYEEGQKGKKVAAKGHGHGRVEMQYKLVEGDSGEGKVWKWAGIKTKVRFNEYEFEKVFLGSAGKFKEEDKAEMASGTSS